MVIVFVSRLKTYNEKSIKNDDFPLKSNNERAIANSHEGQYHPSALIEEEKKTEKKLNISH